MSARLAAFDGAQRLAAIRRLLRAVQIETRAWAQVVRHGLPDYVIQYFGGIGDDLLCSTIAHEIRARDSDARIWMLTRFPELFLGNPDIDRVLDSERYWYLWYSPTLRSRRLELAYTKEKSSESRRKEDLPPAEHILAIMCRKARLQGNITLRPYLFLADEERRTSRRAKMQVVIQCIGAASRSAMVNKLWKVERFQNVVNRLKDRWGPSIALIQIGASDDPALEGIEDLRGQTSIRESAVLLNASDCFVGTVGFLMHLARSVECRSVIIYGGREHSWQSGYVCNENLDSDVECAPCWKWNDCDYDRKCMDIISVETVVSAVERTLSSNTGTRPEEQEALL